MAASVPVPVDTTDSSIWTSSALVVGSMTRWVADGGGGGHRAVGGDRGPDQAGRDEHPPLATAL